MNRFKIVRIQSAFLGVLGVKNNQWVIRDLNTGREGLPFPNRREAREVLRALKIAIKRGILSR